MATGRVAKDAQDDSEMSQGRLSTYRSQAVKEEGFKNRKSKLGNTTFFNPKHIISSLH